jgi:hypothetical protein
LSLKPDASPLNSIDFTLKLEESPLLAAGALTATTIVDWSKKAGYTTPVKNQG